MISRFSTLITILFLTTTIPASAQGSLQTPSEFLGYELGTAFTPHHRVVDYYEYVASEKDNVELRPYGTSYEGRPLIVAIVSSDKNMNQLENIRQANLALVNNTAGTEASKIPIVWLSYNVHGNESVSTEASLRVLWKLANGEAGTVDDWLANTVVVLDPCINPDGRDRYVNWYNRIQGTETNLETFTIEHREPWPGGRTNHYMFDLNRDWAWNTQKESQQRIKLYREWMPQVHVDFHEQGINSPYYFAPAAKPYHKAITPWQSEFQSIIGKNHAKYFDEEGWLYFTRQVFDLFYPSYGDTWPTFNGAIGMTYEQGGSGRAGLAVKIATGDTLTLSDRIDHHRVTSLSTIEATSVNSEAVMSNFKTYFDGSNNFGDYSTYLLRSSGNTKHLTEILDLQGIQYKFADVSSGATSVNAFSFGSSTSKKVDVKEGDLVIESNQSASRLLQVLFEPQPQLADSLTYDITSWSLPYAYGLEAFALKGSVASKSKSESVTPPANLDKNAYAYLVPWTDRTSVQFLSAAYKKGLKVRRTSKSFQLNGQSYAPGTLLVLRTDNRRHGDKLGSEVEAIANELQINVASSKTGLVESGPDFGSGDIKFMKAPRVGLLFGEPMSSYAVGEIWHYFEQQIDYPLHRIPAKDLSKAILDKLDVLILPRGSYSSILGKKKLAELREWISSGGRVVAMESAVSHLAGKDGFSLKSRKTKKDSTKSALKTYETRSRESISETIQGGIFKLKVDNSHPLFFGYGKEYHTLKRSTTSIEYLTKGWNVAVLEDPTPVSGFAGVGARTKVKNTLVFGVENIGSGSVVYMVDNPLFRGFWENGKLLFANAVFAY